ncbi:hypothetical protein B0T20DRAFT_327954, partial [Sordaria brevicollis]
QYIHEPTTVEFDILFPRHGETYAPTSIFPIVVAVQNPNAAVAIRAMLGWTLLVQDQQSGKNKNKHNNNNYRSLGAGIMNDIGWSTYPYTPFNFTTDKNPYYFTQWVDLRDNITSQYLYGEHTLQWAFFHLNCS